LEQELQMPTVISVYAGLLGIMSIVIGIPIGLLRGRLGVPLGDGGNSDLRLAIRRHGNFMEWVPFALILIGLLEMNGVSRLTVHILGAGLVVARIFHAVGLRGDTMSGIGRTVGAAGTALLIVVSSVWLITLFALRWSL
jgi:uncharacterized membrane protein YecN with MAPEG domain